jgi:2-succinyl-5-enolpyruvyl-6-hydroxy-3-cyclohexene-1-carboxylate synthase
MFGLTYDAPPTLAAFDAAYEQARERGGAALIEVTTDRSRTLQVHRTVLREVELLLN